MLKSSFCKKMAGGAALLLLSAQGGAQDAVGYATTRSARVPQSASYSSYASQEKQSLFSVLKELNRQKGVYFLFSEESMGAVQVKAAKDYSADTEKILTDLLKETGLKYKKVSGNTFVIVNEKEKGKPSNELQLLTNSESGLQSTSLKTFRLPITGRVTASDGQPLPGVSVRVKGTSRGTTTNVRGEFTLEANKGETLVISYIGYQTTESVVGDNSTVNVSLTASDSQLSEVVVTALGIRRERKALGYSVTEVKGDELTKAREVNVMNSLVGKVAGLNVSSVNGGVGSASNVIIRGVSSLGQDPKLGQTNQPLYVINGVPIESQPASQGGGQYDNGPDRGDAIGNINPDDIETISVLKGAAASALYGYRAKAGVILITTKSGRGNSIEFNSNYVGEKIIDLTNWQYVYGQGANNIKPATQMAANDAGQSSYGGLLDGSPAIQFDGVSRPYTAQRNNLKNFYQTGGTFTNTLALNKTFTGGAIRFSASDLTNKAVIPYSGLNRQSFNLAANFNAVKNLTIDARANYILEQARNRPFLSDGPGNANFNVMFLPTSVDVNVLKKTVNADGSEYGYSANTFATNPWFAAEKFITNTNRDRLISSLTARYNFNNGFFVQGRAGRDAYADRFLQVVPTGTAYRPNGSITEQNYKFSDLNVDGLAGIAIKVSGNDLTVTPNIGASYRKLKSETFNNNGSDFAVPFVYNIGNAKNKSIEYLVSNQEIHSVYGTLELAWKDYLFLNGSARSDWFSTLATPGLDNKLNIVYPSVSASFVFSEFVKPSWLSFGKLRAGYAVVGQATGPYNTQLTYSLYSPLLAGTYPLGYVNNSSIPNSGLKPSEASEFEIGTEMRLFNNRMNLDVTYYNKKSKNEILAAPASTTSGYSGAVLNVGELQNKGWEALISGSPLRGKSLNWNSSLNGSVNNNKVLSLAAGQAQLGIATSRTGVAYTQNLVGLASNQVMAFDYRYDAQGKIALTTTGLPDRGNLIPLGSAYHKWVAGWNNEFSFKRFNLGFLIDGKWGGKIFSATDWYGYLFGLHKNTLENREGRFGANVNAATYYSTLGNNVSRIFVYDASFVKFRQVTLSYSLPASFFNNKIQGLSISLVARNLFFLMRQTDNIDPEGNYSPFAQGLELGGVPPVRTFGVNLNVKL